MDLNQKSVSVTGFSIGIGTPVKGGIKGTIWLDNLSLMCAPATASAVKHIAEAQPQPAAR